MIVHHASFDYVTATTKKRGEWLNLMTDILSEFPDVERYQSKRNYGKPYHGIQWENGIFMGERESGNGFSHIAIFAGEVATSTCAKSVVGSPLWHKTRIDCQYTIEGQIRANSLAQHLRDRHIARGTKPVITSIDKGDVPDGTVYVGSKESERYATIYIKHTGRANDDRVFTRYEVELKGKRTQSVVRNFVELGMNWACNSEVNNHLSMFNLDGKSRDLEIMRAIRTATSIGGEVTKPIVIKSEHKTVRWMINQVQPAMRRIANSHSFEIKLSCYRALIMMTEFFSEDVRSYEE